MNATYPREPKPVLFWALVCMFAIAIASVLTGDEGFKIDKPYQGFAITEPSRAEAIVSSPKEKPKDPPIAWIPIETIKELDPKTYQDEKLAFVEPSSSIDEPQMQSAPGRYMVTAYNGHCRGSHCKRQREALGDGDDIVAVAWSEEHVPDWIKEKLPRDYVYPVFVWQMTTGNYQWPSRYVDSTILSLQDLRKYCEQADAVREAVAVAGVSAMPQISGGDVVRRWLNDVERIAGPDATMKFTWQRIGGKQDLLVSEAHSRSDLLGTSGKIVLDCRTKYGTSHNELNFQVPPESVEAVYGSPLFVVWTVVSTGMTIYELLHPKVSVWLPETIEVNAKMDKGKARVDFGRSPPAVKLHWSFWMGLLKYEYKRPLTGLVIDQGGVTALFQQSSIYKEVTFPFAK